MLTQGQYDIRYTSTGILFTFQVDGNEYSLLINDINTLRQLQIIIQTFIDQYR